MISYTSTYWIFSWPQNLLFSFDEDHDNRLLTSALYCGGHESRISHFNQSLSNTTFPFPFIFPFDLRCQFWRRRPYLVSHCFCTWADKETHVTGLSIPFLGILPSIQMVTTKIAIWFNWTSPTGQPLLRTTRSYDDLALAHFPNVISHYSSLYSGRSSHRDLQLNMPSSFPTQGVCTCSSLCLNALHQTPNSWLLLVIQVSALQTSLKQTPPPVTLDHKPVLLSSETISITRNILFIIYLPLLKYKLPKVRTMSVFSPLCHQQLE